ncbi:MAG TPA: PQQ-binding-like beta-propeller repeat protein [Myxococcales bacterium]|nr:PQQ-binding-like beta-propeller repeat protein [Myxococcales bacterium]
MAIRVDAPGGAHRQAAKGRLGRLPASSVTLLAIFACGRNPAEVAPGPPPTLAGPTQFSLAVRVEGDGRGTVVGGPIQCGSRCGAQVSSGASFVLEAQPAEGSMIGGWSVAGCAGAQCSFAVDRDLTIRVQFALKPRPPPPLGGGDWGQYRHDQRGGSVNFATFAASEAANLIPLWKLDLGDQGASYVYTQAMITADLVIFTTAASGKVVAVDANTGSVRWTRPLNSPIETNCGGSKKPGLWAAAAVVGEVVYVASPDGHLYALRKTDGSTIWAAPVADPTAAGHGEFIQSSPAVSTALGRLYVGVASSAHCDPVAGRVAAVDLASGAVQQMALLGPGQRGTSVWSSIAVAEDEDRLYVTTGNRVGPLEATPHSQAFLAVDPHSLAVLDHWQNPTPLENSDFGSSPALGEAAGLKLVAATNKDGWLYVLRRDALSAGPVWKYQMAVIDPAQPTVGGDPTGGWGSISTPAFANGRLYAAGGRTPQGEPGSVIAFDPANGAQLWKHATPGYVLAPLALAGEIIVVESSAPDGSSSTMEVLDAASGAALRSFPGAVATYGAPSIGHGLIVWSDAYGHATAFAAQNYRR